jgi:hypothetical protein
MDEPERERGFELHREAQRRAWIALSHRERLAWLEEAKRFSAKAIAAATRRAQVRRAVSDPEEGQ